jgi:hypothetical protein
MDNEKKLHESDETAENPAEIKIDELGEGDLEDVAGGDNSGCNCNCGQN